MDAKKQAAVFVLLGQLNSELREDPECKALLEKLMHRVGILVMGEINPSKVLAEVAKLPVDFSPAQLVKMIGANIEMLVKEQAKSMEKKGEYTELIDTHRSYIKALEKRCLALTDEFKSNGGDVAKYPPIERP
jgi:hypothetical protein